MLNKSLLISAVLISSSSYTIAKNICDDIPCERLAEEIIDMDSRSWFFNRYDRGSTELVRNSVRQNGSNVTYRVNYSYNRGSPGWAEIKIVDGEFFCIRYHDFQNECRTGPKR